MFSIKIADLTVSIDNKYDFVRTVCNDYITYSSSFDFSVSVTEDEIAKEKLASTAVLSEGFAESVCIYRAIAEELPKYDAFVLHAAAIKVNEYAYCFSAQSGIGKTTHILNWKKVYGDKVTIINGDKPIIRFFDGVPYVYGTPWSGKEDLNTNTRSSLKGICFIERSPENNIAVIDNKTALNLILKQVYFPADKRQTLKTVELLGKAFNIIKCWKLHCNRNEDSAITAYAEMIKEG